MMEEDLLKEMILDRETAIQFIETKISDQNEKEKRLQKEQILVKGTVVKNREGYRTELTKLRQQYGVFLRQYHDTKDISTPLFCWKHPYLIFAHPDATCKFLFCWYIM